MYELWMARMLKLRQNRRWDKIVSGNCPTPIVLIVRVVCVAPPKTGTFDRKPQSRTRDRRHNSVAMK